jgi:hypothetical protein
VRYDSRAGLVESGIPGGAGGGEEMYSDNAVIRPRRTEYRCNVTSLFVSFAHALWSAGRTNLA